MSAQLSPRPSRPAASPPGGALAQLFRPIEELLVAGGDCRLTLSAPLRENLYGCTPHANPDAIDFASSTASTVSPEAYWRAQESHAEMLAHATLDPGAAFAALTRTARSKLLGQLGLDGSGTEVVFAPSGTDAQLHGLLLARTLLGGPLTTIIAGADQTGSGTVHTARGCHFGGQTASGMTVEKGTPVAGDGEAEDIGFAGPDGALRDPAAMDAAVMQAVSAALARQRNVLLLAMDSSKLGWRAPSDACLADIRRRWPGRVSIAIDACQMRLSRRRLHALLDQDFLVLITGSKFFTGPAFSGAVLVPPRWTAFLAEAFVMPDGFADYSTCHDWPEHWAWSRQHPVRHGNVGQWLRWECALEEMRLYYAVPSAIRRRLLEQLGGELNRLLKNSAALDLMPPGAAADFPPTIFSFLPKIGGALADADTARDLCRAMRRDLSAGLPEAEGAIGARRCQIGQPVALPGRRAVLRMAISARTVRQCWSADAAQAEDLYRQCLGTMADAVRKLEMVIARPALLRDGLA